MVCSRTIVLVPASFRGCFRVSTPFCVTPAGLRKLRYLDVVGAGDGTHRRYSRQSGPCDRRVSGNFDCDRDFWGCGWISDSHRQQRHPPVHNYHTETVTPSSARIALGTSQQFAATGTDSDGHHGLDHQATWTSSEVHTAVVNWHRVGDQCGQWNDHDRGRDGKRYSWERCSDGSVKRYKMVGNETRSGATPEPAQSSSA
jgi:hypothetical protein